MDPATDPGTLGLPEGSTPPTLPQGGAAGPPSGATLPGSRPTGPLPMTLAPTDWAPGATALGRYRLLERIGQGGMGVVWKAWDEQLARVVALKHVLSGPDPEGLAAERFLREARLAARLRHPAIVAVHDVGTHAGQPYFTCDFVEGRSLAQAFAERPPRRIVVAWVRAVAEALHYAHGAGVIHRDVKPANILIDKGGQVFVADFGLAKETEISPEERANPLTASGLLLGTPHYMSPEQAGGQGQVGPASDQFSLGVVLYEALTGRRPFDGKTMFEIVLALLNEEPLPLRSYDPRIHVDLEAICLKALEKEPGRRYASMAEFAGDLGRYLEGEPIEARPVSGFTRLRRRLARHKVAVAALLTAVFVAGGAGAYALVSQRRATARTEEAESLLAKSQAVSRVLSRWSKGDLPRAARHIGRESLSPRFAEERAEARDAIDRFLRETPDDSAARAAALALAAWVSFQLGDGEEAFRAFGRATEADRDVPLGPLLEALARLQGLLRQVPTPLTIVGDFAFVPYAMLARSATDQEAWAKVLACLDEARSRRVWGREEAEDLGALVEAIRALERGAFEEAERHFDRTITSPALAVFEGWLRFTRGNLRLRGGRYEDALRDFEEARTLSRDSVEIARVHLLARAVVLQETARKGAPSSEPLEAIEADCSACLARLPANGELLNLRGTLRLRRAVLSCERGEDPSEAVSGAIEDLNAALNDESILASICANRATAYSLRARLEAARGKDPLPWADRSIADATRAIALAPTGGLGYDVRAMAYWTRAYWKARSGGDPSADVSRGLADCEEALARGPSRVAALDSRAALWQTQAEIDAARGKDPLASLERAEADYVEVLRIRPSASTQAELAGVRLLRAERDAARGLDPEPYARKAIADADEGLRMAPRLASALRNRARARTAIAEALARRGNPPWAGFDEAARDAAAAVEAGPYDVDSRAWRGTLLLRRAQIEAQFGMDPSKSLEAAAGDLAWTVETSPTHARAWQNLGTVRMRMAEWSEVRGQDSTETLRRAIEDLDRSLAHDPACVEALSNRATARAILAEKQQAKGVSAADMLRQAVADCDEAIRIDPTCFAAWMQRATASLALSGDPTVGAAEAIQCIERAIVDLDEAVRLSPGVAGIRLNRALAWMQLWEALTRAGKDARSAEQQAFADMEAVLATGQDRGLTLVNLAIFYLKLGALRLAERAAEEAVKSSPGDARFESFLGSVREKARQRGLPEVPAWRLPADRAYRALMRDDAETARRLYEEAIAAAGDSPPEEADARSEWMAARYNLACALSRLSADAQDATGLRDLAFKHLGRAVDAGWKDAKALQQDEDLSPLRADPRWEELLGRIR